MQTSYRSGMAVACVHLAKGDTVDLAINYDAFGSLVDPRLQVLDAGALQVPSTPSAVIPSGYTGRSVIYAGLVAQDGGVVHLSVLATCPGRCAPSGNFAMRARRAAPVIISKAQSAVGVAGMLQFRQLQGTTANDTVWLRNVGVGAPTVSLSTRFGLASISTSAAIVGPSTGWTESEGAVPYVIEVGGRTPGFYDDTVDLAGFPNDGFYPRSRALRARFDEAAARTISISVPHLYLIAFSPTNDILAGSFVDTVYRINAATGAVSQWGAKVKIAICCESDAFQVGPDTALYLRGIGPDFTHRLMRLTASGPPEPFYGAVSSFAVLPDRTLYVALGQGLHRVGTDGSSTLSGTMESPISEIVFSASDSAVYYASQREIKKLALRNGTTRVIQTYPYQGDPLKRMLLRGVDQFGRLYLREWNSLDGDFSLGNHFVVLDSAGNTLKRVYPQFNFTGLAFARDSIYGFDNGKGVIWVMPVRP